MSDLSEEIQKKVSSSKYSIPFGQSLVHSSSYCPKLLAYYCIFASSPNIILHKYDSRECSHRAIPISVFMRRNRNSRTARQHMPSKFSTSFHKSRTKHQLIGVEAEPETGEWTTHVPLRSLNCENKTCDVPSNSFARMCLRVYNIAARLGSRCGKCSNKTLHSTLLCNSRANGHCRRGLLNFIFCIEQFSRRFSLSHSPSFALVD